MWKTKGRYVYKGLPRNFKVVDVIKHSHAMLEA